MKRSRLLRRTPLKRGTSRLKRTPLKRGTSRLRRTPLKPKRREGIQITHDGRTIYHGKAYTALRKFKWELQEGRCAECGRDMFLFQMDLHHPGGRGLGGSKRDDLKAVGLCNIPREEPNPATGKMVWLPRGCHGAQHIDGGAKWASEQSAWSVMRFTIPKREPRTARIRNSQLPKMTSNTTGKTVISSGRP